MTLVLTALALVAPVHCQPAARPRPRVALALSGGGARGIAHIGALRALEEAGIPVDAIAANSMGAVVGAIYASGRDARALETIVRSLDWAALFSGRTDRRVLPVARRQDRWAATAGVSFDWKTLHLPAGLLGEHRVNRFLIEHLAPASYAAAEDFDQLPIPFRAVATDLGTGEPVVLARGDLARAVRASMSIPLFFPPVEWGDLRLVDGLVVNNLPNDVAKAFDPAVLVSVDIGSPALEPAELQSAIAVAQQVNDLLVRRRNRDFHVEADVAIRPDLGRHSTTDYSDFDGLIRSAYEATKARIPAIREKLAAAGIDELPRQPAPAAGRQLEGARIAEVVVRGNLRATDALLRRWFNIPVGPGFEMQRGLRAFDKIDATELLERTWMSFEPDGEAVRIVLRVVEAPANRAEVGLGFSESERARGSVRLRNQNTLGFGEQVELLLAASDAESVAQLSLRGERLFLAGLGYRVSAYDVTDKPRYFDDAGRETNRAHFARRGLELALRSSRERWGFVEAGVRLGAVSTQAEAGIDLPDGSDSTRLLFGAAAIDTLDSLEWPDDGQRLGLRAEWSPAGLGGARRYWKTLAEACFARPVGRRAGFSLNAQAGLSGGALPEYDWFRSGGPALVPGYHADELKGAQSLAAGASVRYRLLGQLRVFARAGAGNVFASRGGVTLDALRWGLAAGAYHPSPIGPVSAELALREDGRALVSLAVGWN